MQFDRGTVPPVLSHFVDLTEAEAYGYARLTKRMGWALASEENARIMNPDIVIDAAVIGAAANKLDGELMAVCEPRTPCSTVGWFCRGGAGEESTRQLAAVVRMLGRTRLPG